LQVVIWKSQGSKSQGMYHNIYTHDIIKFKLINHIVGDSVVRVWDQGVYFFYGLRFEPCGC
jgi:hypothetical protein